MELSIIILGAGEGTRMGSERPKVLHRIGGYPLLQHVYQTAQSFKPKQIYIIYGYHGDSVQAALPNLSARWIKQNPPRGTADAVAQAIPYIPDQHAVLILYGDTPLITPKSLVPLIETINSSTLSVMTAILDVPSGYGRIVRDRQQNILEIIEEKDTSALQRNIKEVNTGMIAANAGALKRWLKQIDNNNAQQEYYLTDIVKLAILEQEAITTILATDIDDIRGINNMRELAQAERILQDRLTQKLLDQGTILRDPKRVDIRGTLTVGKECDIDIDVLFEGDNKIGDQVIIGAHCIIKNATIGNGTVLSPYSFIEDSIIGERCSIGPYARIRPNTMIDEGVRIGNFVELKKATVGKGSKINHLNYIGDCQVGKEVNIGAGTITCNYDGQKKHKTTIEDHVFVGSDVQLIAPVTIAKRATIAAGSTITKHVEEEALAITRTKQKNIPKWKTRKQIK